MFPKEGASCAGNGEGLQLAAQGLWHMSGGSQAVCLRIVQGTQNLHFQSPNLIYEF